jgi:uncharacterized protein
MMYRIGIISDTHGLLRPEAERRLTGVDHIVHAGDIGRPEIIDALRRIAPVTAIRGNVDSGEWAREYPDAKLVRLAGVLYLNPGSAGRRRFKLPITLATVEVTPEGIRPEIHDLGGD